MPKPTHHRRRPTGVGLHPAATSRAAHLVLAELLADGVRRPDPRWLRRFCAAHQLGGAAERKPTHRLIVQSRVAEFVGAYFRHFCPDFRHGLMGCEFRVGGVPLDVVWRCPDGRFLVDELKAARAPMDLCSPFDVEQTERQLRVAIDEWGDAFAGLRLLPLGCPRLARTLTCPAQLEALR